MKPLNKWDMKDDYSDLDWSVLPYFISFLFLTESILLVPALFRRVVFEKRGVFK